MTITRSHHPFEGQSLEVLRQAHMPGGLQFVLFLPDGVGGGEKGCHFGGEVAPCQRELFAFSLSLFSEVLFRTARSRQGRAVVGRGVANP